MLLRRVMRHVRDQNWFAVLLDFIIVIAGVVIGFQITAWNAERAQRASIETYSKNLVLDLEQEVRLLDQSIRYYEAVSAYSREAEDLFAEPDTEHDGAFLVALYGASQYIRVSRIDATYQALVSQGVGGLVDDRLAGLMIRHYSSRSTEVLANSVLHSDYRQRLRRAMSTSVQNAIRGQCGDIRDQNGYVVALSTDCSVDFGELPFHDVAAALRADNELRSDLALLISTLDAYIADSRADLRTLENGLFDLND